MSRLLEEAEKHKKRPDFSSKNPALAHAPAISQYHSKPPKDKWQTPSDAPYPVFVMCQPMFIDNKIENNAWIAKLKGKEKEIDYEKNMAEWFNLYRLLSTDALVYLIPPVQGLQDQCYVNSFAYLPHFKETPTIILSNFKAEGREGEEVAAGGLLTKLGYNCVKPPTKFEGDAELKWLKDDIYFGGYGIRTDLETYDWIEENYGAKIIRVNSQNEYLYHLDCLLFVLNEENVIACTELLKPEEIKSIEKVARIHPVKESDCMECVCNSIKVGDLILNSSDLEFLQKRDPSYNKEYAKNKRLLDITSKLGLEVMYTNMSEAGKSGAALSCFTGVLTRGK